MQWESHYNYLLLFAYNNVTEQSVSVIRHMCCEQSVKIPKYGWRHANFGRTSNVKVFLLNRFLMKILRISYYIKYYFFYLQLKLIGSTEKYAVLYDIEANKEVSQFSPKFANEYKINEACFNGDDTQILYDGNLFDIRSGVNICKIDKMSVYMSGIFNPRNEHEIMIESMVFDSRNRNIIRENWNLEDCRLNFDASGNRLYATRVSESRNLFDCYDDNIIEVENNETLNIRSVIPLQKGLVEKILFS